MAPLVGIPFYSDSKLVSISWNIDQCYEGELVYLEDDVICADTVWGQLAFPVGRGIPKEKQKEAVPEVTKRRVGFLPASGREKRSLLM